MAHAIASSRPAGSVFWPVVGRFAWKEVRATRDLAIGAAGILAVLLTFIRLIMWSSNEGINSSVAEWFLVVAAMVSALYVVAACVAAFSAERELKTQTLLFQLPHQWAAMGLGKFAAVAGSTLFVAIALGVLAIAFANGHAPGVDSLRTLIAHEAVFLIEAIAWSLLISLVCPYPLIGALLACAMLSVGPYFIAGCVYANQYIEGDELYGAIPYRLVIAGIVMALNVVLVRRWIELSPERVAGRRGEKRSWRRRQVVDRSVSVRRAEGRTVRRSSLAGLRFLELLPYGWVPSLSRLMWHTWRSSWGRMLACVVAGTLLTIVGSYVIPSIDRRGQTLYFNLPFSLLFVPALLGAMAFGSDQRERRYLFLAQHSASCWQIWLSRIVVWIMPVLLFLVLVLPALTMWYIWDLMNESGYRYGWFGTAFVYLVSTMGAAILHASLAAVTAFACGQLMSLWLRSEIRAGGAALLLSIPLLVWALLSSYWRISPFWSLLPICIGALAASRIDMHAWLNERRTLASWARTALAVVVPTALVFLSVPSIRHWQVEHAMRSLDPATLMSLRARADEAESGREINARVADGYRSIHAELHANNGELSEDAINRLRALTTEKVTHFTLQVPQTVEFLAGVLEREIISSDNLDEARDNLLAFYRFRWQLQMRSWNLPGYYRDPFDSVVDPAFDRALMHFATMRGQSPERLESLAQEFRTVDRAYPLRDQAVVWEYVRLRQELREGVQPGYFTWVDHVLHELPGEKRRAEKALDLIAGVTLEAIHPKRRWWFRQSERFDREEQYVPDWLVPAWRTAKASPLLARDWPNLWQFAGAAESAELDSQRRGLQKVWLALVAHHLRHGEYPVSLEELPMDVSSLLAYASVEDTPAVEFRPEGFPLPLDIRRNLTEAGVPLIWIAVPRIVETTIDDPNFRDDYDEEEAAFEEAEVPQIRVIQLQTDRWSRAVVLPLPRSEDYPTPATN